MRFRELRSAQDIADLVQEVGFLPFWANEIRGFSVEENCPPELWFSDTLDGPWEWKGPVARSGHCLYGKFFGGKAGFVSKDCFADFANLRRDGYDFDARYDDGLAARKDRDVYDTVAAHGELLSKTLKDLCGYRKGGNKGFDTVITRLQMQTYVTIADFVYMQDRHGKTYGWGVAQYSTPEHLFGYDFITEAYKRPPAESRERLAARLRTVLPEVDEDKILRLLK